MSHHALTLHKCMNLMQTKASIDAHRGVGEEMNRQAKDKERQKETARQAFALSSIPDVAKRALE